MLDTVQDIYYKEFEKAIRKRENLILSSKERAWGKTTVINELGLTLQTLGFTPVILTLTESHNEYFATKFLLDANDLRGLDVNTLVILVDEYKYIKLQNILEYCYLNYIPVVGFADFEQGE